MNRLSRPTATDWQPGDPLHRRTGRANPWSPMFTLKAEFSMDDAARWPEPLPWHDLDRKEDA